LFDSRLSAPPSGKDVGGSEKTDEILMECFKEGDVTAFEKIFHRYKTQIYNYAYRFLGNEALSEEVVQELFFKVIKMRGEYECRAKFSTWLYRMGRNLCIDKLRKKSEHKLVYLKVDSHSQVLEGVLENRPNQEELFHRQQLETLLQHAIGRLNPEQREVFLMREKLALPFAEIAEILGYPLSTVKSRMNYALKNLKEYLSQHYNFEDIVT